MCDWLQRLTDYLSPATELEPLRTKIILHSKATPFCEYFNYENAFNKDTDRLQSYNVEYGLFRAAEPRADPTYYAIKIIADPYHIFIKDKHEYEAMYTTLGEVGATHTPANGQRIFTVGELLAKYPKEVTLAHLSKATLVRYE